MQDTPNEFELDYGFGDFTGEIFRDLYQSEISVSLSWVAGGSIEVKIGDPAKGVLVEEDFFTEIAKAIDWLRIKGGRLYPNSPYAEKHPPPRVWEHMPGSSEAVAAGCTCPTDQNPDQWGSYLCEPNCPHHGAVKTAKD
jgi:hypothetical protein